jgi:hypothetical protein
LIVLVLDVVLVLELIGTLVGVDGTSMGRFEKREDNFEKKEDRAA